MGVLIIAIFATQASRAVIGSQALPWHHPGALAFVRVFIFDGRRLPDMVANVSITSWLNAAHEVSNHHLSHAVSRRAYRTKHGETRRAMTLVNSCVSLVRNHSACYP